MSLASQVGLLATRVGQESKALWTAVNGKAPTAHNHVKANITDFAHAHAAADLTGGVGMVDTRAVATTPNDYNSVGGRMQFKQKSTLGIPDPGAVTYAQVWGFRGYSDSTGGEAHEIAYANDGIWHRQGATTIWGSWFKIGDSANATVFTNDARLSDARTPVAHNQAFSTITGTIADAQLPTRLTNSVSRQVYTTVVPARLTAVAGAPYVDWTGTADPAANMLTGDSWTYVP